MNIEQLFNEIDRKDIPQLLSDMVGMPSYDSERDIVEYIIRRFDKINVKYEITEVAPGRQNLIARIGTGNPILILNSHMDTVPPGDLNNWKNSPFELTRSGDQLIGLGACDAKGSLASMLTAFEVLAKNVSPLNGQLILQAVCCEETFARGTLAEVDRGITADAAIIGEPNQLIPMIGHKGGMRLAITVHGKAAHGSCPQEGINSVSKAAVIIQMLDVLAEEIFQRSTPLFGNASLAVTKVNGGEAVNVIPDSCTIVLDRRLIPGETVDGSISEISAVIDRAKESDPDLDVSVEKIIGIEPCKIGYEEPIIGVVQKSVVQVKNRKVEISGFLACCDMWCLVEGANIPTMILGPGETSIAHKANESIPVSDLYEAAKIYTAIAMNWFTQV